MRKYSCFVHTEMFDVYCILTLTGTTVARFKLLVCLARCAMCSRDGEESSLGANLFAPQSPQSQEPVSLAHLSILWNRPRPHPAAY